ncbi:MAG: 5'/3'-nucleotidase SurE [Anaerolineaceae bacterium]
MKKTEKPQILLTNDDSISSPGLWAAAEALSALGFVHVVAPRVQQTSMGRALPRESDGIIKAQTMTVNGKEWQVYSVGGSPAQAFLHGLYEVLGFTPDLVVSGINYGENIGSGVTISGTVGAALEAATLGIPALAVSLETPPSQHYSLSPEVDFSVAAYFTRYFAEKVLKTALPFDVGVLKVDVPNSATPKTPWVITRQSRERYYYPVPMDPQVTEGSRNMQYEVRLDQGNPEPDSDLHAVMIDRVVSVTPLSFDLTARVNFDDLAKLLRA